MQLPIFKKFYLAIGDCSDYRNGHLLPECADWARFFEQITDSVYRVEWFHGTDSDGIHLSNHTLHSHRCQRDAGFDSETLIGSQCAAWPTSAFSLITPIICHRDSPKSSDLRQVHSTLLEGSPARVAPARYKGLLMVVYCSQIIRSKFSKTSFLQKNVKKLNFLIV